MIGRLEGKHRQAAGEYASRVRALESSHATELEAARSEVREAHEGMERVVVVVVVVVPSPSSSSSAAPSLIWQVKEAHEGMERVKSYAASRLREMSEQARARDRQST